MRIVTLSDHASAQIKSAREAREAENERLLAQWKASVDEREARKAGHINAIREAWRQRRLLPAFASLLRLFMVSMVRTPEAPTLTSVGQVEGRYQGGQEGEARVLAVLSRLFDDQWTAFRGYCNRSGETDVLLLGPTAVVALEVKSLRGVVHCHAGVWNCDKIDKYGNVVAPGAAVQDAAGRSPAQQVNSVAEGLCAQLERCGLTIPVRRGVVLAHPASRVGRMDSPDVDFVGVLMGKDFESKIYELVRSQPRQPDLDVNAIEQVIRQDHQYHASAGWRRTIGRKTKGSSFAIPAETEGAASESERSMARDPAPNPRRRIKVIPPTAPATAKLTELELRQARAIRDDVRALLHSDGKDAELEERVRKTITGHLQKSGRVGVLSVRWVTPDAEAEHALLRRLIRECRQVVAMSDRTLHAIVVPLAVRWLTPAGADWSDVWIDSVDSSDLASPAMDLCRSLALEKVSFSRRLFEGGRLEALDARLLRRSMIQLDAGNEPDVPELKPAMVSPSPLAAWQIVYLLAVAVTAPDEPLCLDEETRRLLAGRHEMLASAVTKAALEATGTPHAAEAFVEGVWTLADGVRHGRRLQRRHVLETILAGGNQSRGAMQPTLRCWYAADMADMRIRVLFDWGPVRAEREFLLHDEDDPVMAFRALLDEAVAARVPSSVAIKVEQLDLLDYQKQARALGLTWLGKAH